MARFSLNDIERVNTLDSEDEDSFMMMAKDMSGDAPPFDMSFMRSSEASRAAVKIQSVYRGFQARREMKSSMEAVQAAIRVQSKVGGFMSKKNLDNLKQQKKKQEEEELPDLKAKDVNEATVKIQAAYKGFKVRKDVEKRKEIVAGLPDLKDPEVKEAA